MYDHYTSLTTATQLDYAPSSSPIRKSTAVKKVDKSVEGAVFAHIKAIRSLGRTTVNASEIAKALDLPLGNVTIAVASLKSKGVKVVA